MKKQKKDLDKMTSEEIDAERTALASQCKRWRRIGSGVIKVFCAALGLGFLSLGITIGGGIYDSVEQRNLDMENAAEIATHLANEYEGLAAAYQANEIDMEGFARVKESIDKTYKQEYYTTLAPEEVKERYQTLRDHDFAFGVSAATFLGTAIAMGLSAFVMDGVCDKKKNKLDHDCEVASDAYQRARDREMEKAKTGLAKV